MAGTFDQLDLTSVHVSAAREILDGRTEHAREGLSCVVSLRLETPAGPFSEPHAELSFGMPSMPNATLLEIEARALELAAELLRRLALEGGATLLHTRTKTLEADMKPWDFSPKA